MCEYKLQLHIILVVLCFVIKSLYAFDDSILFSVTRAPRYFGVLQDHKDEPISVEISEDYLDQDYLATNKKRHKSEKVGELEDFDDEDTNEASDSKDKDIKVPIKENMLPPPKVL